VIPVDSLSDERLAAYRSVADPAALAAGGLFVAEGRSIVARLARLNWREGHAFKGALLSVLLTPAAWSGMRGVLEGSQVPVYVAPQDIMNVVVGFNIHRGCLALGRRPARGGLAGALERAHRIVALEQVTNPDNLGGILRSAAAFGVHLIVLGPGCADPLYRKCIRTSMGSAFDVPWVESDAWPEPLARLRSSGVRVLALTTDPGTRRLKDVPIAGGRLAVLAGSEGQGLSPAALAHADERVTISMTPLVDSLNVATAVSIALYHLSEG
jgi:tRNA G18 (ribose-2'-O)-methylase SpoU